MNDEREGEAARRVVHAEARDCYAYSADRRQGERDVRCGHRSYDDGKLGVLPRMHRDKRCETRADKTTSEFRLRWRDGMDHSPVSVGGYASPPITWKSEKRELGSQYMKMPEGSSA